MSCVWLNYMVQYFQYKNCVGSSPKTKKCVASFLVPGYKSLGRFRSDREKTRKAEISRDFSAFFAPNFFQISIDPFSIFLRVEGFELPKRTFSRIRY